MSFSTEFQMKVHQIATDKGFHSNRDWPNGDCRDATDGERLALIAAEVGEAINAWQQTGKVDSYVEVDGKVEGVLGELADVVIRCFDLAETVGSDLGQILEMKSAYNEHRPYRHGKLV